MSSTMKASKMQRPKQRKFDLQCALYMEITSLLNEFVAVEKAACMLGKSFLLFLSNKIAGDSCSKVVISSLYYQKDSHVYNNRRQNFGNVFYARA